MNIKYGKGLHLILAGDTNELRLKPILDLSPSFVQIATKPTRTNKTTDKQVILDPIIMTLAQYYKKLNGENLDVVPKNKLLGVIVQDDLKWNANTASLVEKKANARMVILRKLSEFGAPRENMKIIYKSYTRNILEQSAVVWHTSLTTQIIEDQD